jgi:acyl carrier protein
MEVFEYVKETILELSDIAESHLTPQLKLTELGLDSLDYVEIQVAVKKKFGVQIRPEVYTSGTVQTLGDFCEHIESSRMVEADTAN